MTKHKHYNEIVAWAEGKQIQFKRIADGEWEDCCFKPNFTESTEYRVKPEPVKIFYKRYLTIHNTICIENKTSGYNPENSKLFKKWIDIEWQEYEVEDD